MPSRMRPLSQGLAVALTVAVVAFTMELITEGAAWNETVRHLAARMFVHYDAVFYSQPAQAASSSNRILVVDIGAATLDRFRSPWPLSYGHHARLLERLRQGRPAAVFIDIQFESNRADPSLPQLLETLCALKADGIPLFLAAGSEASQGKLRPELEEILVDAKKGCVQKVAVSYEPATIDRTAWSYPLNSAVGGKTMPSAALALASSLRGEELLAPTDKVAEMGLVWGSADFNRGPGWVDAPGGARHGDADNERHYCRGMSWRDLVPLQGFLSHAIGFEQDHRPRCPMQASIEARDLISPKPQEAEEALYALIHNRAVLYGVSVDPNDFFTSPLQGDLPGVYLHAQATDNLLRFGPDWRRATIADRWGHDLEMLITFSAFFSLALVFFFSRWALLNAVRTATRGLRPMALAPFVRLSATLARMKVPAALRGVQSVIAHLGRDVGRLGAKLLVFYLSLLLAVPLSFVFESGFQISVIGFSSLLAFCLFGELFVLSQETAEHLSAHQADESPRHDKQEKAHG